jgi:hypothetical protein
MQAQLTPLLEPFGQTKGSLSSLRREALMNKLGLMPLIALSVISAAPSFAQDNTPPASTVERPTTAPDSSGSGTAPEGKGTTGWTGGARDQTPQSSGQSTSQNPEAAKSQPSMATGKDLQGPAKQFPANQTPE